MSKKYQNFIVILFLMVSSLMVYGGTLKSDFINFDDHIYVTENSHVQSGLSVDSLLWAFGTTYAEFWHPLTWLSLMADYQFYGLNAAGYHLTNLLLHILSSILLFLLFHRMTSSLWKSAFVSAFFALHPLHVESVAWVAERKDVLSAFFCILTLYLYVYYTEKASVKKYLAALLCFAASLMSKPMVVTLPLIMILLDYWPLKRFGQDKEPFILWQIKEKIPFFALSGIFSVLTLWAHHSPSVKGPPSGDRLINALFSFSLYIEKTFCPQNLAVFYPFPVSLSVWQVTGAVVVIIAISFVVLAMAGRWPYLLLGWLWYSVMILPVLGIIRIGDFAMADRYHYLPSIGIAVMIAWGIPPLLKSEKEKRYVLFPLGILFLTVMAFLSWKQCGYWKNSATLFEHTLRVTKNNYLAHDNYGSALSAEGRIQEAVLHFNESIRLKPDYALPYDHKGAALLKNGDYQTSIKYFNQAIRLKKDYLYAYNNRGISYAALSQYSQALKDFNEAIRLKPDYADSYNNKGLTLIEIGKYQHAIGCFSQSIWLRPDYTLAYNNRGIAYAALDQHQQALMDYSEAIRLEPDYVLAYKNRGVSYAALGKHSQALKDYSEAIRRQPQYYEAYNNRGEIYDKLGQYQLAIRDYNDAIRLKPDYAAAYYNRGMIYLHHLKSELGCDDAQKACQLGKCDLLKTARISKVCP